MKKYSSNQAQKGKTAFRTPDRIWAGGKIKKTPTRAKSVRYRFGAGSRQVKRKVA